MNILLSKKDKTRCIANKTKAIITGITESKLYHTVPDSEVNLPEHDIPRCTRNRSGGCLAWYVRKNLCFNTRTLHCKEIKNLDVLLSKLKPINKGVFYRPPNKADFMDLIDAKFSNLNLKDNEMYLVGDNNINLLQKENYILNSKKRHYLSMINPYFDKQE